MPCVLPSYPGSAFPHRSVLHDNGRILSTVHYALSFPVTSSTSDSPGVMYFLDVLDSDIARLLSLGITLPSSGMFFLLFSTLILRCLLARVAASKIPIMINNPF